MGTLINVCLIIAGGILGLCIGKRLPERYRETLMLGNAVAVVFIGIGGTLQKMFVLQAGSLETQGTMMVIISIALGALLGEWLNLDGHMERAGEWLKQKTGNAKDASFVNAFVTASLTVCIGAMAVVGAIEDGIRGDYSILAAKGVLDCIIIMVMTSSLGKGAIFSFIPVGIVQGLIFLLATQLSPFITPQALDNLSYVGSILIFCVGINLLWPGKIRAANLLPAIFIAAGWTYI